jgi:type 2 lantibiotic biosynthesis protein LanM
MKETWPLALSLEERARLLRDHPELRIPPADRAHRRTERWRGQAPFSKEELWRGRLAEAGIGTEELAEILELPAERLCGLDLPPPQWLRFLLESYQRNHLPRFSIGPRILEQAPEHHFLFWLGPLIERCQQRIEDGLAALEASHGPLPVSARRIWESFSPTLFLLLQKKIEPTAILELNAGRLEGTLAGETGEERFASFVELLRDPAYGLGLLGEYPVLGRLVAQLADNWCTATLEFAEHLSEDWEALRQFFGLEEAGGLAAIQVGAGDRHRGGRSVLILGFEDGKKLVYKPHSLAVDVHFQEILEWINGHRVVPAYRVLRVLDRGRHGWVEFVEAGGCESAAEIDRFYQRLGGNLALLHAFEATDFHFENVLAAGEHPMLVDLETFFSPYLGNGDASEEPTERELRQSVLRTGLLPFHLTLGAGGDRLDISGMSRVQGLLSPHSSLMVRQAGTDEMRLDPERRPLEEGRNRPRLRGEDVSLLQQVEPVLRGFSAVYDLLVENREAICRDGGLLDRFAGDEIRVLFRLTITYHHLIARGFHPDVLRDGLDQDRHWDRLWMAAEGEPFLEPLIPAERHAGQQGDVAMFTTRPGTRGLWWSDSDGIAEFFAVSGLDRVRQRMATLGPVDREKQKWFIRASIATLKAEEAKPGGGYEVPRDLPAASSGRFLEAARAVGDRLAELAFREPGKASWLGLAGAGEQLSLRPLDIDLYGGLPGLALFLGFLGDVAQEPLYSELAREALATVLSRLEGPSEVLENPGAFSGVGGIVYVLAHLGGLWRQENLLDEAQRLARRWETRIESDETLDLVGGCAGFLGALLALHRRRPSPWLLDLARRAADHLVRKATPLETGAGWRGPHPRPLTGFSHGAAGIACMLGDLSIATGERRWLETIERALAFERSTWDPARSHWPDLRRPESARSPAPAPLVAWCHGAAGIGLGRIRLSPLLDDDSLLLEEIDSARRGVEAHGFGSSHCLCHGDLGNVEIFLQLAQSGLDPAALDGARRIGAGIVATIGSKGWVSGVPTGVETPGLMTGLAGIGYGLLRLAAPERAPAVLVLEP